MPPGAPPPPGARGGRAWIQKAARRRTWQIEAGAIGLVLVFVLFRGAASPDASRSDGTAPPGLAPPGATSDSIAGGRPPPPAPPSPVEGIARAFEPDGSIRLDSGVRVRLFGVALPGPGDAPVVSQTAIETLDDVVRGQRIAVEFDPILTADDQAGQPVQVGYVWFIDEAGYRRGMLNALVLAYGFGRPVTEIAYRYDSQFAEASAIARGRRIGVWMGL